MFGYAAHLFMRGEGLHRNHWVLCKYSSTGPHSKTHQSPKGIKKIKIPFFTNLLIAWLLDGRVTCACAPCASGRGRRGLRRDGRSCAPSPPPSPAQAAGAAAGWSSCCCWTGTTRTVPGAWLPYIVLDSHWVGSGVHPGQLSQSQPSPHVNPLQNKKTSSPLANT